MNGENEEHQQEENRVVLNLSRKDKIWVAVAIIAIIVGFVLAVVYDL